MHNNKKNEELQTRREFFKKAAKGALPILGAIVLAGAPGVINAAREQVAMGCKYNCEGACTGGCKSTCHYGCDGTCKGGCAGSCKGSAH